MQQLEMLKSFRFIFRWFANAVLLDIVDNPSNKFLLVNLSWFKLIDRIQKYTEAIAESL